jgi:hypothetical protein
MCTLIVHGVCMDVHVYLLVCTLLPVCNKVAVIFCCVIPPMTNDQQSLFDRKQLLQKFVTGKDCNRSIIC